MLGFLATIFDEALVMDECLRIDGTTAGVHSSRRPLRPKSKLSWRKPNRLHYRDEYGREMKILIVQDSMGYAESNREGTEDGSKHSSVKLRKHDSIGWEDNLCRSSNSEGCERVIRNNFSPPGNPISSKLPAHIIGDVLEVYEFLHRFYEILGFQVVPSFKELEEELSCSGFDLNETEEVKDKVAAQRSVKSNGTLLSDIHIKLLKLLMREIASVHVIGDSGESKSEPESKKPMHEIASVHVIGDNEAHHESKPEVKKGTGTVIAAKGCQPHVLVNELTWPEMARRYVLALLSIKRSLFSVEMNNSDKSKVFRCLQSDGGVLCGSTGITGIEEDVNVLVEAIKRVFGSLDTENDMQYVNSCRSGTTHASDKAMLMDTDNIGWSQELEPVRKLPTNVGSRMRNCIKAALDKGPPLWAKEILEHSISKEVYKGNASGPTKRLVISVLDKLCSTDLTQQPNQERNNRKPLLQSNLLMSRCHFALRRFLRSSLFYSFHANAKNKILCNLLSVQLLKLVEAKEGILESPVKLSRPLDFIAIDLRLSAGAYGTSYEDFLDDVRQVLANLRVVHKDEPELLQVANKLSDKFEQHYEIEVNSLLKIYGDYAESDYMGLMKKKIDDTLTLSRELPKCPLEHKVCKEALQICKVCGVDMNDDVVLLCDRCQTGYHTYCLEPPLQGVPPGDWFCPRCVETSVDLSVEPSMENPEATHDAFLPANLEDLSVNEVGKAINPLAAAMTQKEYGQWSLDERVFLLKFLCGQLLNSSVIRQHLVESIREKQTRADTKEMQQSEDMPGTQENVLQSELLLKREICLSKLSLRREYLGTDSSGRLYWILSEPNGVPFLIVDPSSSSIPWVSYQSEEEIDELLGWLNNQDEGEKLLKESIDHFKKTNADYPNNNDENQGEVLVYGKRNNYLGIKATSLLTTKFAPPDDLSATGSCNNKVEMKRTKVKMGRCDCMELIFPSRPHCLCCHKTFLSFTALKFHNGGQCKTGLALEKSKEPSSSTAHDEHKENELSQVSGKSATVLRQLKMDILDIEAALPEGALNRRKSHPEQRWAWRAFVKTAVTILETIQAVILLEDMIKIDYLKNWWCYWASPSAAVKRPTLSSLALRIYALDSAIEYEKNHEPDTPTTLPQEESVPPESNKRRKGKNIMFEK